MSLILALIQTSPRTSPTTPQEKPAPSYEHSFHVFGIAKSQRSECKAPLQKNGDVWVLDTLISIQLEESTSRSMTLSFGLIFWSQ